MNTKSKLIEELDSLKKTIDDYKSNSLFDLNESNNILIDSSNEKIFKQIFKLEENYVKNNRIKLLENYKKHLNELKIDIKQMKSIIDSYEQKNNLKNNKNLELKPEEE